MTSNKNCDVLWCLMVLLMITILFIWITCMRRCLLIVDAFEMSFLYHICLINYYQLIFPLIFHLDKFFPGDNFMAYDWLKYESMPCIKIEIMISLFYTCSIWLLYFVSFVITNIWLFDTCNTLSSEKRKVQHVGDKKYKYN